MTIREAMEAIWKEVYFYAIEEDKQDFAHLQGVMLEDPPEYKDLRNSFLAIAHLVDAALSAPPSNCDVGTAEEQGERCLAQFNEWRRRGDGKKLITAIMEWAHAPYAEEESSET